MLDVEEKMLSLYAKKFLKIEMGRNLIKVPELAKKINMEPSVLSNRISRGAFSVGFFLKALRALNTKEVPVPYEGEGIR